MDKPKAISSALISVVYRTVAIIVRSEVCDTIDREIDRQINGALTSSVRNAINIIAKQPQSLHVTTEVNRVVSELR